MNRCQVAAVTLDIESASADLRTVCEAVFPNVRNIIAAGLIDVLEAERATP
jgi:hypothetical protein